MTRNKLRLAGAFGVLSALLYSAAYVVGAWLRPGYSSRRQAVSELIEAGAPNKTLIDVMIFGFHLCVVPFAWGLRRATRASSRGRAGPVLLAGAGGLGMGLTLFFPCDPGCEPVTFRGKMHILIAIPMGFLILFAILAFARRFEDQAQWAGYTHYSRLTFGAGLALAVATALFAKSPVGGLLERILTLAYQQWYAVMGLALMRRS